MKIIRYKYIEIMFLVVLFSGCSLRSSSFINNPKTNEALNILGKIESINKDIKTSKGTGWVTITDIKRSDGDHSTSNTDRHKLNPDRQQSKKFRMAWAASFPDKIRLTLLSAGHPVETILADGKDVIFVSHTGKHRTKKLHSANPSLKDVVSIPVTIQDILSIFAGQVPIGKFDTAEIAQISYSSALTHTMVILKRRWNGNSQNIVFTSDNQVASFSLLNESRRLIHSVFNEQYKNFDSFSIPVSVKIRDNDGRVIDFEITTYQPNIVLNPDIFVLTEQG